MLVASPAASQDSRSPVAGNRAQLLLSAEIPHINLGHVEEPIPASSDLQLTRNFQNASWDYIEIGDFHR
jgi:hypothetical protein